MGICLFSFLHIPYYPATSSFHSIALTACSHSIALTACSHSIALTACSHSLLSQHCSHSLLSQLALTACSHSIALTASLSQLALTACSHSIALTASLSQLALTACIAPDPLGYYIIDDFQYIPELLSYVKVMVDNSGLEAQFILTGSNQFVMMQDLSQSLAGRTAIFELLPFSFREANSDLENIDSVIHKGFYPRLIDKNMRPDTFYNAYLSTYLQRDIRLLSNVQNLDTFNRFLSLCAGRTGSILNKEALANDVGVDAKTIGNWLSLLQTSYTVHLLQPCDAHANA